MLTDADFIFPEPLSEGVIVRRKSQFTFEVDMGEGPVGMHCPTTGRIGDIDVAGRPCLVSLAHDATRKTKGTVEAVSLARPEDADKRWIGINQNAANRYVEHYLKAGAFADAVGECAPEDVQRERFLGASKLDFLAGSTYLEVKTPLQALQVEVPEWVGRKRHAKFASTGRFQRHITELANSLAEHERAVLLVCFVYDNPGFEVVEPSANYEQTKAAVDAACGRGVEAWQANFEITPQGVQLAKHFQLEL